MMPLRARALSLRHNRSMKSWWIVCAFSASLAWGATLRLYLKDGSYQQAREYKVLADRVRYFSTERGDWEEIPLDLIDLKRTEREVKERDESVKNEAAAIDAEEKAERAARREIERIPLEPGVYYVQGDNVKVMTAAESKIINNKRRSVLKAVTPIPIVSGKATLELDGTQSKNIVKENLPEFYIRLSAEERFGLIKLTPTKTTRIVEKIETVPITKEMVEQPELVETFRKQIGEDFYKIWPQKALEPGEYAVVEYTEGKGNIQVWDFRYEGSPGKK